MKFYLDFEATQFSNRIISIGCVSETGESFNTLVKPARGEKISPFITKLTGITNEQIQDAPSADEAFMEFYRWIQRVSGLDIVPTFYVYGNDSNFIDHTIKYMTEFSAIMAASAIKGAMVDYSKEVLRTSKQKISLSPQSCCSC